MILYYLAKLCSDKETYIFTIISLFFSFAVSSEMVEPFLEGFTLEEAMEHRKIYIVDLKVLENLCCKNERKVSSNFYYSNQG